MKNWIPICLLYLALSIAFFLSFSEGFQFQSIKNQSNKLKRLNNYPLFSVNSNYDESTIVTQKNLVHSVPKRGTNDLVIYTNPLHFISFAFLSSNHVFGQISDLRIFQSSDAMMTWKEVTEIPSNSAIKVIVQSPADPNLVFFLGVNVTYYTPDLGKTFIRQNLSLPLTNIQLHPTQSNWALSLLDDKLFLTKDLGKTWKVIFNKVHAYDWCNAGLGSLPKERICLIADVRTNDAGGGGASLFIETLNLGASYVSLLPLKTHYFIVHPYFYFLIGETDQGIPNLYVSNNNGTSFQKALIPSSQPIPYLFPNQILDDRSESVWIGVIHGDFWGTQEGNIYTSDQEGYKFTSQLQHVHSLNNWWDFEVVSSIEGTYLTNILHNWDSFQTSGDLDITTKITYDNGDTWSFLTPPSVDSNGNPINCNNCFLNLFGLSTWLGVGGQGYYGNFYSDPNAMGLILATGNVGNYLLFDPQDVNTYLSRDAGQTWIELMKGSTVYEYGDSGGILVLARNQVWTTTVYYSLNEGQSWIVVNFTATPVVIVNIFSTDSSGKKFVIFARQTVNGITSSIYFGLDFTNIQERACIASDYETWSLGTSCVLGRNITYLRRKRHSQCYNPPNLNHTVSIINCNCTANDYECDYGYEPSLYGKCLKDPNINDLPVLCLPGQATYFVTQGYRKVPGDSCQYDVPQYAKVKKPCPSPSSSGIIPHYDDSSQPVSLPLVLIILISVAVCFIVALVLGIVIGARNDYLKSKFSCLRSKTHGYSTQLDVEDEK